jgi:multisubunit Na+/H+ antiporter MnhG subunit
VETAGKILLLTAAALAIIGAVLLILGKLGLGRLPGDILIRRDGVTIFIPLGSMLLLSIVLSLLVHLFRRL